MKKLAVLLIVLSFTLVGCTTTCKYRDNAVKQEQSDTTKK